LKNHHNQSEVWENNMQVIGAGFGRTGTLSFKKALEQLGFGPCYHMEDMIRRSEDMETWLAAGQGRPVDWRELFAGYRAAMDFPASLYYKELLQAFPDAKVVLTVRDPEQWYASMFRTAYTMMELNTPAWVRRFVPPYKRFADLIDLLIWDGLFAGRFADREYAINVYNWHIEDVKRNVPADKLLVYNVRDGWEPLCAFLGCPVPAEMPFPYVNDQQAVQRQMLMARAVYGITPVIGIALAGLLVWLAWQMLAGFS
jgi:hypothetical protein